MATGGPVESKAANIDVSFCVEPFLPSCLGPPLVLGHIHGATTVNGTSESHGPLKELHDFTTLTHSLPLPQRAYPQLS